MEESRQRLERKITGTSTPVRNIAVDKSGPLKDDRGTDAEQLYRDAERLAQDLKNGQRSNAYEEEYNDDAVDLGSGKKDSGKSDAVYSGPSVLSYTLDGRKASKLPIPAYRCYAGGEVTVIIVVNPQGMVIGAEVKDDISSTDQCLRNFAVRAARLSRFSQSSTAPARQTGEIVYRFIAQ
jgi:outer membrane biosynthesis protein TonB